MINQVFVFHTVIFTFVHYIVVTFFIEYFKTFLMIVAMVDLL